MSCVYHWLILGRLDTQLSTGSNQRGVLLEATHLELGVLGQTAHEQF